MKILTGDVNTLGHEVLKIPFGVYRNEPILSVLDDSNIEACTRLLKSLKKLIKENFIQ